MITIRIVVWNGWENEKKHLTRVLMCGNINYPYGDSTIIGGRRYSVMKTFGITNMMMGMSMRRMCMCFVMSEKRKSSVEDRVIAA